LDPQIGSFGKRGLFNEEAEHNISMAENDKNAAHYDGGDDIDKIISGGGIVFAKAPRQSRDDGKVRTKAKKKKYITGAHGSGAARQKAKYRERRANRSKPKR